MADGGSSMAFTMTSLRGTTILVVRSEGKGHVGESEQILDELRRLTSPEDGAGVLFDIRALEYLPSPAEARYIGERYGDVGAAWGWRMAHLAPPGAQFGIARTVEIVSGLRGASARVFSDETEAIAWLREGERGAAERKSS